VTHSHQENTLGESKSHQGVEETVDKREYKNTAQNKITTDGRKTD
jgi:hypothetical protein